MKKSMRPFFIYFRRDIALNGLVFLTIHPFCIFYRSEAFIDLMHEYVFMIFFGIVFVFLYNYLPIFARPGQIRSSALFLGRRGANMVLDVLFVMGFQMEQGSGLATVIARRIRAWHRHLYLASDRRCAGAGAFCHLTENLEEVMRNSAAACLQQSVMNFGILMIQGLVNTSAPLEAALLRRLRLIPLPICRLRIRQRVFPVYFPESRAERTENPGGREAARFPFLPLVISQGFLCWAISMRFCDAGSGNHKNRRAVSAD